MKKKKININPDITSLELEVFRNMKEEIKLNNQQQKTKFKIFKIL